ncbi:MAG: KH domain-containing protein [Anaerolineae bacterium]|nr:KH domain-containing protein [Anaerolineae bacterium]
MDLAGLVEYIAKHLVADPQQVSVKVIENPHSITLELRVAPEDTGRVIGKNGRIANAMRTLVRVAAARENKRVNLEIV